MFSSILNLIYLIASVTFIIGLKMLSRPESARKGNLIAAGGMGLAIVGTIFLYKSSDGVHLGNLPWMFGALVIGGVLGAVSSRKVKMTQMPEMVSLFNGMGGACAMLISLIEFNHISGSPIKPGHYIAIVLGLVIGSISFAGSIIAYLKLSGKQKDISFKGQHIFNLVLFAIILVGAVITYNVSPENAPTYFYATFGLAILYGIFFVLPIGGADMPVVISLLNSLTGVAAACGGFLYNNKAMLTGGILVGAAGTLLTVLMCKAMNRSLLNVIIGNWGGTNASAGTTQEGGSFKEVSTSDAAMLMSYAKKVIIVPGYGLAVAQAQHVCHELEKILTDKGVEVSYAIHPVAGRMPGHMNVLLAEADVAYEKLEEMEDANNNFKTTDVVLILGANDVVNPAAKNDPASPIYGMPILEVEDAKNVIVNKRSMKPGYAGIENSLFYQPKTSMLFGDAKKVLQDLCAEVKAT
jgi:NAD(P) transhydrogenase subunit beta